MILFEHGYDRRNGFQETDWEIMKPNLWAEESKELSPEEDMELREVNISQDFSDSRGFRGSMVPKAPSISQGYQPIYDPKNQLSSLVKNAQNNEEALQQRNERLRLSRMRAREEYGW